MPLAESGEMSLGGSTSDRSVNLELGYSATALISMNDTAARALTIKTAAGSTISMSDFYGASTLSNYWLRKLENIGYSLEPNGVATKSRDIYLGVGNYVAYTSDFIKYTRYGVSKWHRRLSSTSGEQFLTKSIAVDTAGSLYATLSSATSIPTYGAIVKYNDSGIIQWKFNISRSSGSIVLSDIAIDLLGNLYILGQHSTSGLLFKLNSLGTIQWVQQITSSESFGLKSVVVDSLNNVIIGGTSSNGTFLVKFNASGSILWQRHFLNISINSNLGLAIDTSDNLYFTGIYLITPTGNSIIAAKVNNLGALQWCNVLQSTRSYADSFFLGGISVDSSGNAYVTSYIDEPSGTLYSQAQLAKYNTIGTIEWMRDLNMTLNSGNARLEKAKLALDTEGNICFLGWTYFGNSYGPVLIKLPGDGQMIGSFLIDHIGPTSYFTYQPSPYRTNQNITSSITSSNFGLTSSDDTTSFTTSISSSLNDQIGTYSSGISYLPPVSPLLTPPPAIGASYQGGYYGGQIYHNGVTYNLVVAPFSSGHTGGVQWKTSDVPTGGTTDIDGPTNTAIMNNASHPAAKFCADLNTINVNGTTGLNGYTDWYMPAKNELEVLYYNLKPFTDANYTSYGSNTNAVPIRGNYSSTTPGQTSSTDFRDTGTQFMLHNYWSSTEIPFEGSGAACIQFFGTGYQYTGSKDILSSWVRAIRRVPVQTSPPPQPPPGIALGWSSTGYGQVGNSVSNGTEVTLTFWKLGTTYPGRWDISYGSTNNLSNSGTANGLWFDGLSPAWPAGYEFRVSAINIITNNPALPNNNVAYPSTVPTAWTSLNYGGGSDSVVVCKVETSESFGNFDVEFTIEIREISSTKSTVSNTIRMTLNYFAGGGGGPVLTAD